mmetsp:Transcript_94781/g.265390  ORF Transcript_94781/g.265390 Transcript_94781/m.265390 type:complete len:205 (-) Transcript_94781:86-700(-)
MMMLCVINPMPAKRRTTMLLKVPSAKDTPSFGRRLLSVTAASIIDMHACASGAGSVGSERNFRVARPTKPQPMREPARQARMFSMMFTPGTLRPWLSNNDFAASHSMERNSPAMPRSYNALWATLRYKTCSKGSEKITPDTTAMPADPATCARFRKREPSLPRDAALKAPQPHSTTRGLTPGVMPALRPATTIVQDKSNVTNVP